MGENRSLARWLVARRRDIEARLRTQLGAAAPAAGGPEAEALRRFRSFALAALQTGDADASPALDGVRVSERRVVRLLEGWTDAAAETAGADAGELRAALEPLAARFETALRATHGARRASGAPRTSKRRAVSAAIDRVADVFLAIDTDTACIEDANPAAGALLGTTRDHLLGADALSYVPDRARDVWATQLDAMAEGSEPRRFAAALRDDSGRAIPVEARITRFATRRRTLALVLARPV